MAAISFIKWGSHQHNKKFLVSFILAFKDFEISIWRVQNLNFILQKRFFLMCSTYWHVLTSFKRIANSIKSEYKHSMENIFFCKIAPLKLNIFRYRNNNYLIYGPLIIFILTLKRKINIKTCKFVFVYFQSF